MTPWPSPFCVTSSKHDGVTVLAVEGDLDIMSAPMLGRRLDRVGGPVVVDLRPCTFVAAEGLSRLLARRHLGDIALVCVPGTGPEESVRRIAPEVIPVYDTVDRAVTSLGMPL